MNIKTREYLKGIWGVFSCVAFCTYSYLLIIFFWDVPSFLLRYNTTDIVSFAAYQFMFALFESITVTAFITLLGFILPAKFIRNTFQVSGSALAIAFAFNAFFFKDVIVIVRWLVNTFSLPAPVAFQVVFGLWTFSLLVLPIGLVIASKNDMLERIINKFVEKLSVLVSLYVFLSVIGTLIVIARNIF